MRRPPLGHVFCDRGTVPTDLTRVTHYVYGVIVASPVDLGADMKTVKIESGKPRVAVL